MAAFILKNKAINKRFNEYLLFNTATEQVGVFQTTPEHANFIKESFLADDISREEAELRGYFEYEHVCPES